MASDFVRAYKDALACVEQIAERRQSIQHYEREAGAYTQALASDKLQIQESSQEVTGGSQASKFHLIRAFNRSKTLFEKNEFGAAKTREDFLTKLDSAIGNNSKPIRLDL